MNMANRTCLRFLALQLFSSSLKHQTPTPSSTNPIFSHHINVNTHTLLHSNLSSFSFSPSSKFSTSSVEIPAHDPEESPENESTDHENGESIEASRNAVNSEEKKEKKEKKPLDVLFREAVGLTENRSEIHGESTGESPDSELNGESPDSESNGESLDSESNGELPDSESKGESPDSESKEIKELKKKIRNLEREVHNLHLQAQKRDGVAMASDVKSNAVKTEMKTEVLSSMFSWTPNKGKGPALFNRKKKVEGEDESVKELAPELVSFINRLHDDGYLKTANFSVKGKVVIERLNNSYARDFIRTAAERFGQDHEEIAKWLSASDTKNVALFGCPSLDKGSVFAAKSLRSFFNIQEDVVCRACVLKSSCKFVNQQVGKREKLILADVMRVLTVYAFDRVPQNLVISDEVKLSVHKLLKEVINLTQ